MQKKISYFFIMAIIIATISNGCKKDKEESRMDLLTGGQWKLIAFTLAPPFDMDGDGDLDSDAYALMEACEKDDFSTFRKDGKLEVNDGQLKCDPMDPQVDLLDWSFANGETELIIDGDRATINELTASRLRLQGTVFGIVAEVTFSR